MDNDDQQNKRDVHETNLISRNDAPLSGMYTFNAEYGYMEALLRGFRSGFLTEYEYGQLCLCESLDDVRLTLGDTDFKLYLQSLPNAPSAEQILDRCTQKMMDEFNFLRRQSVGQLSILLEMVTWQYLINSIQFVIKALIKGSNPETLLAKCHPLGKSPHLKSVLTFDKDGEDGLQELYETVLIETPVAPYFARYFAREMSAEQSASEIQRHYDERDISTMTEVIEKLWLEDFFQFTQTLGGDTAVMMKELLEFEADRRAIRITINSFNTSLNEDSSRDKQREEMYCNFGKLYPYSVGEDGFRKVKDWDTLRTFLAPFTTYNALLRKCDDTGKTFNDVLYEHEVRLYVLAFESQCHFASFYAYVKLKQQEERNIKWILSCIVQKRGAREKGKWIPIFAPLVLK